MKVELEIITDRLPTKADGEIVLRLEKDLWYARQATMVRPGDIWMRQPPPPKPPIDTSLAASISRFTGWIENAIFDEPLGSDCIAVRDAARKWDEHDHLLEEANQCLRSCYSVASRKGESVNWDSLQTAIWKVLKSQHKAMFPERDHSVCCKDEDHISEQASNDPDGVGEGWRRLNAGEMIQEGDEVYVGHVEDWRKSYMTGITLPEGERNYRRRIEAEQ